MSKVRLAIFASGEGTNAENIIRHFEGHPRLEVALVVSNRSKAGVLSRAEKLGVETLFISREDWNDDEMVLEALEAYSVHWIVLSGFLLMVPAYLIKAFPDRIVNIHPALLPRFGGKGMYGMHVHNAVKQAGEKESGITIHMVNEAYDEGRVVFQATAALTAADTPEDIRNKVQELEHVHFARVIESLVVAP